jgi:putative methyltransferase (TIGR04325 family)
MLRRLLDLLPSAKIEGYEHPDLVEAIFRKTAAFCPTEPWPEIGGARTVLDFGGGCGLHYKQARSATVRWAVVETPAMVARASTLQTENLRFFSGIDAAASWLGDVDVMHSNGALQYTPDPHAALAQLCAIRARTMLWYRLFLSDAPVMERQTSRLSDNGPRTARVKRASVTYERKAIAEAYFLRSHQGYAIAARGSDWFIFERPT